MPSKTIWLWLLLCPFSWVQGQDLFDERDILEVELITDLPALQADRGEDVDYHDARLRYFTATDTTELDVELRARGHFRRKPQVCDFPPLKLKTRFRQAQGTLFEMQPEIKLVCHCRGDIYVMREYMLYRVYDILSAYSLQVRPARITYRDASDSLPPETHFAFFLEHQDVMARRIDARQIEEAYLQPEQIDQDNLALVSIFNLMIGNTDWDVTLEKNLRIMQPADRPAPILIPYDFDWSAAVDAPYTDLSESYDRRKYRGICVDEERYRRWVGHILARAELLLEVYQDFDWPSGRERRQALRYLRQSLDLLRENGGLPYLRARCADLQSQK